ncbi:hypothetical protein GCM10027047_17820 [Rhodococcus aerolatus]
MGPAAAGGPPDPADLRLVRSLADRGRLAADELAAAAGMGLTEAVVRLARLQQAGLRLVVGVEGDQQALRGWVGAWEREAARAPAPPPVPRAPSPPAAPPVTAPPGWGPPQPAAWATTGAVPAPGRVATHRRPGVGDRLEADGPAGRLALTLVEVVETADALYAAAGHALPAGSRAAVVHTEVATGAGGYPGVPDALLVLVLADGTEVAKSAATLSSRPPFQGPPAPGVTVGGHTLYELGVDADIVAVRWRAVPGAPPLEWRV